jgi:hypothetical protein
LTLTGTLSAPRPAIDARRLAGRVAAAVALGTLAGPAALLPFIDLGSGSLESPCTVVAGGK